MKALSIGSFNSFWRAALITGGIIAWSLPVWNIVVNPYQVFDTRLSIGDRYSSSTTNERFLKVDHLIKSRKSANANPDALIVGSSIMGLVDTSSVNRYFPDRHFYNLAFLAAKPDEILTTLQELKKAGVIIRTVVYGLEPIAFTDTKVYGPAYRLYPGASERSLARYFFDLLFVSSLSDGIGRLVSVISGKISVRYDIEGTGQYHLERYEMEIGIDHDAFISKQFPVDAKPAKAPPWVESRFNDFQELVRWLESEGVDARFYLNPLHPYVARAYGAERLAYFKQKIAIISGHNDLKDCTNVLSDAGDINRRFYDYKHFRPSESALVMACAFNPH
jgi:hypothetical protein